MQNGREDCASAGREIKRIRVKKNIIGILLNRNLLKVTYETNLFKLYKGVSGGNRHQG